MQKLTYFSTFSGIGGFETGIEQACGVKKKDLTASGSQKSTATQLTSTSGTSQTTQTTETSPQSKRSHYLTLISWLEAFPAKYFPSQENVKDFEIHVARSSLKSLGLLGKNNHACYYLKTSKGFYLTTRDVRFSPSSKRLMNWGTTVNGKCLTAKITVSPRTVNACLLSDILEERVDQKYFLSQAQMDKVLKLTDTSMTKHGKKEMKAQGACTE